ncbi:hypothetical protein BC943DRAFT_363931 [Umbelopsis sp. AD052]|nr:hypothetical protein BC943DRAFT_363931 [Umbelopsis sp. AD052]
MSSSLANARRKFDASVRAVHLPTDIDPQDLDEPGFKSVADSGVLLLSVLQSRMNWSNSIFPKYRHDNVIQPRRAANTRRKWPNMKFIGTYTLHLGPHVFPETNFYEAYRMESWTDVGVAAGVIKPITAPKAEVVDTPMLAKPDASPHLTATQSDVSMAEASQTSVVADETDAPLVITDDSNDMPVDTLKDASSQPPSIPISDVLQSPNGASKLIHYDVVFEFKEVPNERFVLPKVAIAESLEDQKEILLSFMLPLEQASTEDYFKEPMAKIALWGSTSEDAEIQAAVSEAQKLQNSSKENEESHSEKEKAPHHQAITIKLQGADENIGIAIKRFLRPVEEVQKSMMEKMQSIPVRHFLQYRTSYDAADDTIEPLKNKINTMPEIITGPIAAEKKRSELLNAIKLGKRPRSDYQEHEAATQKRGATHHPKDDNLLKCHYCSTRHTSMWRRGPDGEGTLCNGCGLKWKQGEILVGAPVISWHEEKQLAKQRKKEEEKMDAELPLEPKVEPVEKKKSVKQPSHRSNDGSKASSEQAMSPITSKNIGYMAAQIVQQQHKQVMLQNAATISSQSPTSQGSTPISSSPAAQSPIATKPPAKRKASAKSNTQSSTQASSPSDNNTTAPSPNASRLMSSAPAPTPTTAPMNAVQQSVTSGAGIPLPTLSIVFSDSIAFTHPNCGVALLEDIFSIKLRKDGFDATTIDIHKNFLQKSDFNIVFEGDARREILVMTATLSSQEVINRFDQVLIDPESTAKQHDVKIRFLEKLDPAGGGVVKRILERWVTANPLVSMVPPSSKPTDTSS